MVQSWDNSDGLHLVFGPDKATTNKAGEYRTYGANHEVEVKIDLTTLTSSPVVLSNTTAIPTGSRIQEIVVIGETAATSSGNGTIDIGLIRTDRTTELDYNGLIAAMVKGSVDLIGENNVLNAGTTYAGALVGTTTANVGLLTANYNTAAYQTGVIKVKIRYYKP